MRFRRKTGRSITSNPNQWIGFGLALIFSLLTAVMVILGIKRYVEISENLPSPVMLENLLEEPEGSLLQPTAIYDRTGQTVLWRFESPVIENRHNVRITDGSILFYTDLPEEAIRATIIAIDPDYHSRPDRFIENILDNRPDPIPQSLAENLLLWYEPANSYRQIRINLLGDQIVGRYGRLKILEWFLNSAYYGNHVYGIHQAAWIYFGKGPEALTTAESALLAGVALYPSLNPYDAPTAAKENQETILFDMVTAGVLSESAADQAAKQELIYADPDSSLMPQPPAFANYLMGEISNLLPSDRLQRGGYQIISTLDSDLQNAADCTTEILIDRIYGGGSSLDETCPSSSLMPGYEGEILTDQDQLEINLVLLDPKTGELLALKEGIRGAEPGRLFDPKPVGTLITPFIYLNSFTQGLEPASLVWDIPLSREELSETDYHPGCVEGCGFQGPVNIRTAMANDYLSPALQGWDSFGSQRVLNTLTLFGFSVPEETCAGCLPFPDSPELNIIDLAQGYGIFANQGVLRGSIRDNGGLQVQPISVLQVEEISDQSKIELASDISRKVIGDQLTYLINDVLRDENARAGSPGSALFQIGRPAAVKSGFIPGFPSYWVAGYTPQLVVVVWASTGEKDAEGGDINMAGITAGLWRALIQYSSQSLKLEDWQLPAGMVILDVCYPSGLLPSENCPRVVREPFIEGNEPYEEDVLFQMLEVNRETGLLASVFTPPQQIEERVYLSVPEIAYDWAQNAGIPAPPDQYDLEDLDSGEDGFSITDPEIFSFIRGETQVIGSLPEEGFDSARLQYGMGMNPGSWLQIGTEITAPGKNISLGTWDTKNLEDGIYALQLVKIGKRQEVDKTSLVVSVDNTPPEILLVTDYSDQEITYQAGKEVVFQADFVNQSEIKKVRFYIDSGLKSTRTSFPFVYTWPLTLGEHRLRITAEDQAGNQGEQSITFQVVSP